MKSSSVFLFLVALNSTAVLRAVESPSSAATEILTDAPGLEAPVGKAGRVWSAFELGVTPISFPSYEWIGDTKAGNTGTGLFLTYEFIPIDWYAGKVGIGIGSGFGWINNVGLAPETASNLYTFPVETFLSYRLDAVEGQVLVPFAKVGPSYTMVHQVRNREDVRENVWGGFYGFTYSLGGELFLNALDKKSASGMKRSIGISGTYLMFEYRNTRQLMSESTANLSGEQYRLGLRFEM